MDRRRIVVVAAAVLFLVAGAGAQRRTPPAAPTPAPKAPPNPKLDKLKQDAATEIDAMRVQTQQMVDQVFSYGELGFQEFETSKYLTAVLERHGFTVQRGIAGIPTAWLATWGSGKPVIALGSDIDGIPQASQKPGVAYHDPIIEGAPGHGEGHNSGVPLNITAAVALKALMEREHLSGTLKLWPGVAEELDGTKAYYIRDGFFKDVDVCLFAHVSADFGVGWGESRGTGLVSVEYQFKGESAHAAAQPWRGRSALDAVELMDIGWNFRREHLRLQQRSHDVVTNGGDQPNVVPPNASVWYYFREIDYPHIKEMWETGNTMAKAAAMMTGTDVTWRILGSAWMGHFNKTVAETMYDNIRRVGLPAWDDADLKLARGLQAELKVPVKGLATEIEPIGTPVPPEDNMGGGSDDIGDISWNVPTVVLRYPANMQAGPGHSWANAVTMATPIAHKGVTAGAKAQAMTALDLLLRPELVEQAWAYFRNVQTKDIKYTPFISPDDKPAIWLNKATLEKYRPEMRKYYYDASKYPTYLAQLGITYPTVR
ncbi:MAG TPA: amidohydrolase [Vicinamibacterales bacterium]|jgi:aminobenzoyl-glutamate utilization protein B|nr:amidohydrolase [Vicinamibacterales bacterium]